MAGLDFVGELAVLFIIGFISKTTFGLGIVDIANATFQAGYQTVWFFMLAGTTSYVFAFLFYSTGTDYYMSVDAWGIGDTYNDCANRQKDGESCCT